MNCPSSFALAVAAGALVALHPAASAAQDGMQRKSGLWELRMSAAAPPMTQCVDQARDGVLPQWGAQLGKDAKCTQSNVQKQTGRMSFESSCQMTGMTSKSTTVISGDMNSAYRMEVRSKYDPPFMGQTESSLTIDAKWLGACKPGQRPGDTTMPAE
jgi:hypothetical protein